MAAHRGWWPTWRLMLRLVRRDLRRRPVRSTLTALLVALPAMLVAAGGTVIATFDKEPHETIAWHMGSAQAAVELSPDRRPAVPLTQDPAGESTETLSPKDYRRWGVETVKDKHGRTVARPLPGDEVAKPPTAKGLEAVTGGAVVRSTTTHPRIRVGDRRIQTTMLGIDGRSSTYDGMAELTSGRWPRTADEVLVSPDGEADGLPTSGTLTSTKDDKTAATYRVVGTVGTPQGEELVGLPRTDVDTTTAGEATQFLIDRSAAVTWDEVQELNGHGFVVRSRFVIEHPESAPVSAGLINSGSGGWQPIITLGTVVFVILVALLAGPAFSTSSAAERRVLAQLGSNGATRSMLRRYVLAKALLLGGLSSVVGVTLGATAGALFAPNIAGVMTDEPVGPVDLRWGLGAILVVTALGAAIVAALIPAVQAGRISVIRVLRGFTAPARVRGGWPILGLLICAISGLMMIDRLRSSMNAEFGVTTTAIGLFLGALMIVPWVLSQVGRLGRRVRLPLRIAMRDVGRQRARSFGGVTAILASVTIMTAGAVAGTSDIAEAEQQYVGHGVPVGHVRLDGPPDALRQAEQAVKDLQPDAVVRPIHGVDDRPHPLGRAAPATGREFVVGAPYGDCTIEVAVPGGQNCANVITSAGSAQPDVALMEPATAAEYAGLSPTQVTAFRDGAVVLRPRWSEDRSPSRDAAYSGPTVALEWGTLTRKDGRANSYKSSGHHVFPAIQPGPDNGYEPEPPISGADLQLVLAPETAKRHGWELHRSWLDLSTPGGLNQEDITALRERMPDRVAVSTDLGPGKDNPPVMPVLFIGIGLIVLVATLITTALAQTDGRADQATLSAVGAGRRIRRQIAAGQAATVGLVGSGLGLVLGLVVGVALAIPLTMTWGPTGQGDPIIAIPWLGLLTVVVGVPLLAAALATLLVRGDPPLTRRTD